MATYRDIIAWQKSHQFVLSVYTLTKRFPADERYGLTSQLRRAAVSITANIVEGYTRASKRHFAHHLDIARCSLEECKYYFVLGHDLGYIDRERFEQHYEELNEIGRLIFGLIRSLSLTT